MRMPLVTEIQRFSLQDGPGIRTTVYLKGCPLHCPWCHNPETINPEQEMYFHASRCIECGKCAQICPSGAIEFIRTPDRKGILATCKSKCTMCLKCVDDCLGRAREVVGRKLDMSVVVQEALADEIFFRHSGGGVTVSGGEPLLFSEFLLELTRSLKKKASVHIAIETSGFAKWEVIEPLLETIDLFIIDIKTLSAEKYRDVIGGSLPLILSNLERLLGSRSQVRVHLPIIPGFNDTPADTEAYVEYLGRLADRLTGVDILPFHSYAAGKYAHLGRENHYKGVHDLASERVLPLANALKLKGVRQVTIGGIAGMAKALHETGGEPPETANGFSD